MNITSDDEPKGVHERIQMEVREIAEVLVRQTGKTQMDVWEEALSLHRVRYETEIQALPES